MYDHQNTYVNCSERRIRATISREEDIGNVKDWQTSQSIIFDTDLPTFPYTSRRSIRNVTGYRLLNTEQEYITGQVNTQQHAATPGSVANLTSLMLEIMNQSKFLCVHPSDAEISPIPEWKKTLARGLVVDDAGSMIPGCTHHEQARLRYVNTEIVNTWGSEQLTLRVPNKEQSPDGDKIECLILVNKFLNGLVPGTYIQYNKTRLVFNPWPQPEFMSNIDTCGSLGPSPPTTMPTTMMFTQNLTLVPSPTLGTPTSFPSMA
ncbi:hypothetical protein F52700_5792 [Fusarium sp. NRRL 52700]|nr:hypothetical protein F52700_5792 [Fusarium sp. NRRL 52700]